MAAKTLELTDSTIFNNGCHKKVYTHPENPQLCIKIPYNAEGQDDLDRELFIRRRLQRNNISTKILPKYFGTTETTLGKGYIFELIKDFDGNISLTLDDYLKDENLFKKHYEKLLENILFLKKRLFEEKLVIMGMWPENVIIQRLNADTLRAVLVNDLGSAALIPLEYYFEFLNKKRTQRRWQRFLGNIASRYSYPQAKIFLEKIK